MYKRHLKLGLIKGGQLGRMLLQAAVAFDLRTYVMDDDDHCSCRDLCHAFTSGDASSFEDVYAFGKQVDILIFEYEHVHVPALRRLKLEGVCVYPDPDILELVQDKGRQKEFYRNAGIPTADFRIIPNREALKAYSAFFPAVQKTCKAGYDGKGVYALHNQADISGAFDQPSVLESFINFDKEIAVIAARNSQGQVAVYKTVAMVFHPKKHLVEYLRCPADISADIEAKAVKITLDILDKLKCVGVLAVEMFVTKEGEVLVNEIAPRVHNSGHHTLEAALTSQFEQHLRAVLGLPLGSTAMTRPSVMVNLLGEAHGVGKPVYCGVQEALAIEGVYVHFYGKAITKPFRKMGHATIVDTDMSRALAKAEQVKQRLMIKA